MGFLEKESYSMGPPSSYFARTSVVLVDCLDSLRFVLARALPITNKTNQKRNFDSCRKNGTIDSNRLIASCCFNMK